MNKIDIGPILKTSKSFIDFLRHPKVFGPKHRPHLIPQTIADFMVREIPGLSEDDAIKMAILYKQILHLEFQMEWLFSEAIKNNLAPYCRLAAQRGVAALAIRSQVHPPASVTEWVNEEYAEYAKANPAVPEWRQPKFQPSP